jgi:hypothetical protein
MESRIQRDDANVYSQALEKNKKEQQAFFGRLVFFYFQLRGLCSLQRGIPESSNRVTLPNPVGTPLV